MCNSESYSIVLNLQLDIVIVACDKRSRALSHDFDGNVRVHRRVPMKATLCQRTGHRILSLSVCLAVGHQKRGHDHELRTARGALPRGEPPRCDHLGA